MKDIKVKDINVKEIIEKESVDVHDTLLKYAGYSADDAYARLKIVREVKDDLGIRLNKHVRLMPDEVRRTYEELYLTLKKLEGLEAKYVISGE